MTLKVIEGHIRSSYNALSFKTFQEYQRHEDTNFYNLKYDLKGHLRSYETTFMP